MNSPTMNTLRSFWTPETNRTPEWLREVRRDKAVFLLAFGTPTLVLLATLTAVCVSVL